MAKIKLANFGVYAARKVAGVKGKNKSAFNACIGSKLKGQKYPGAPATTGGRLDPRIRNAFKAAVQECKNR